MKSILDPTFRYTASFDTDLRRTFARIRREHRKSAQRSVRAPSAPLASVSSITGKKGQGR